MSNFTYLIRWLSLLEVRKWIVHDLCAMTRVACVTRCIKTFCLLRVNGFTRFVCTYSTNLHLVFRRWTKSHAKMDAANCPKFSSLSGICNQVLFTFFILFFAQSFRKYICMTWRGVLCLLLWYMINCTFKLVHQFYMHHTFFFTLMWPLGVWKLVQTA